MKKSARTSLHKFHKLRTEVSSPCLWYLQLKRCCGSRSCSDGDVQRAYIGMYRHRRLDCYAAYQALQGFM